MHALNDRDEDVIELGVASQETKGQARIDVDPGGGELKFLTGVAQD